MCTVLLLLLLNELQLVYIWCVSIHHGYNLHRNPTICRCCGVVLRVHVWLFCGGVLLLVWLLLSNVFWFFIVVLTYLTAILLIVWLWVKLNTLLCKYGLDWFLLTLIGFSIYSRPRWHFHSRDNLNWIIFHSLCSWLIISSRWGASVFLTTRVIIIRFHFLRCFLRLCHATLWVHKITWWRSEWQALRVLISLWKISIVSLECSWLGNCSSTIVGWAIHTCYYVNPVFSQLWWITTHMGHCIWVICVLRLFLTVNSACRVSGNCTISMCSRIG